MVYSLQGVCLGLAYISAIYYGVINILTFPLLWKAFRDDENKVIAKLTDSAVTTWMHLLFSYVGLVLTVALIRGIETNSLGLVLPWLFFNCYVIFYLMYTIIFDLGRLMSGLRVQAVLFIHSFGIVLALITFFCVYALFKDENRSYNLPMQRFII